MEQDEAYLSKIIPYTRASKERDNDIQNICLSDNMIDLFTEVRSTSIFKKLVHKLGMS